MDLPSALTILHFQLALFLLRSALAKVPIRRSTPSPIPREARQQANQAVTWMDVYWRSVCQTRETLVAISGEYPNEVEYIFVPSCVLLSRCSGCCNDEQLQCVPTDTDTVLMQILKVKHRSSHLEEMSFVQHRRCECRPKKEIKRVPESPPAGSCLQPGQRERPGCGESAPFPSILLHAWPANGGAVYTGTPCSPCSSKRRHHFEQNPLTCECKCRLSHSKCRQRGQELNEHMCRCEKQRR
ncbi:vascular endothelial growth factor A-like isoform X2 [Pristis pectinata]|uniref:vascular endothelial growth factor A-like isoform X2 n=1 Tax=Pristis pectinata TaxID=685728 RepID=UPI00223CD67C|nr:vascular endothelial growth factor A-like isoform X2 [Pristis pectinata]